MLAKTTTTYAHAQTTADHGGLGHLSTLGLYNFVRAIGGGGGAVSRGVLGGL